MYQVYLKFSGGTTVDAGSSKLKYFPIGEVVVRMRHELSDAMRDCETCMALPDVINARDRFLMAMGESFTNIITNVECRRVDGY